MTCGGVHCAGCAGGTLAPPVALAALLGFTWVADHLVLVAVTSAACGILSVAAVVALMRWQDRRQAAFAARGPLIAVRAEALPPRAAQRVIPQAVPPAIETHYHLHFNGADPGRAAALIRTALPGTAGDATTEEE